MPRFFVLSAVAGFLLWLSAGTFPFTAIGLIVLAAGATGLATSLAYLYEFRQWQWRLKLASLRRAWRSLTLRRAPAH